MCSSDLARPHQGLGRFGDRLVCHQDFKPTAEMLEASGWKNEASLEGKFSMVLLLPERTLEGPEDELAHGPEPDPPLTVDAAS